MPYAQTNYPNVKQGINGKYSIAQIGCFITAFANIMERFGVGVTPPGINDLLIQRNLYIDVDDGIRDDVGWTTIIALYPQNIRLEATGNGAPASNNSIVRFITNGGFGTHFCLVQDARAGTIIDSWDGKVKHWSAYGGPVAYATYSNQGSAASVPPQGGNMIPDEDNWFHRFNKLAWQIFGREISREEFRKHFVGVQPFRMVEILSDHGEAVGNVEYAQMGRRAKNENWIGQIEALKKERDNVLYPYVNGISGAAEVPVNANPDGLNAAIQAIKAKDTKIEELGRALEILQKGGGSGIDAETKADIGAIKATVEWIKNLLSKVFKGDA